MPRKPKSTKHNLEQTIDSSFSLKRIVPMTQSQQDVFDAFGEGYNMCYKSTSRFPKVCFGLNQRSPSTW